MVDFAVKQCSDDGNPDEEQLVERLKVLCVLVVCCTQCCEAWLLGPC